MNLALASFPIATLNVVLLSDSCIYGDYLDPIGTTGLRCADLVARAPHVCYRERESQDCCSSCGKINDTNHPGSAGLLLHSSAIDTVILATSN